MIGKRFAGILILKFALVMGCSRAKGDLKTLSEGDFKATQQELIDNWSDYNLYFIHPDSIYCVVFDPKNDDQKILVGMYWGKVKDQETWKELMNGNITSDGDFSLERDSRLGETASIVREIWGLDNQIYGYVIYKGVWWVTARLVEENTLWLDVIDPHGGAGAP